MAHGPINASYRTPIAINIRYISPSGDSGWNYAGAVGDLDYGHREVSASHSTRPWIRANEFKHPTSWRVLDYFASVPRGPLWLAWIGCASYPGWRIGYDNGIVDWGDLNPPDYDPNVLNRAEISVLTAMKDETSAAYGQNLAERKDIESLLVSSVERIAHTVIGFKKNVGSVAWRNLPRDLKRAPRLDARGRRVGFIRQYLGPVPEAWLELQYGWKPLMQDVYQAMKTVDFFQRNNQYRFSKSAKVASFRDIPNKAFQTLPGYYYRPVGNLVRCTDRALVRVDYALNTSSSLAPLASVGLANPIDMVWELLPFSFVVDWFLPLGSWFYTFDAAIGKTFIGGSFTQTCRIRPTEMVLPGGCPVSTLGLNPGSGFFRSFKMDRAVYSTFPSPVPPAFKNPCSPSHFANALSLLATAFDRGVPSGLRR